MTRHSVFTAAAVVAFAVIACSPAHAEKLNLWPDGHAELAAVDAKDIPTLETFPVQSEKPVAAILVIPGGGYKAYSSGAWGHAKACQANGVAAFVLRYRLPGNGYRFPAALHDAQRAMRIIRSHATEWNIDPDRIGVLGSSSGGHLASLLSNMVDAGDAKADDPIEREGCRPAFTILLSPVITFLKPYAHMPSRVRMLGPDATDEQAAAISPEKLVTDRTPPAALMHGLADTLVPPENSKMYAEALEKHGVRVILKLVEGMTHTDDPGKVRDALLVQFLKDIVPPPTP